MIRASTGPALAGMRASQGHVRPCRHQAEGVWGPPPPRHDARPCESHFGTVFAYGLLEHVAHPPPSPVVMPTRQYRDPSGTEWEIFEVRRLNDRPNAVRPVLATGWLAFSSAHEKRRLANYPAGWLELGDDELHELLSAALVVPESRTGPERPGGLSDSSPGLDGSANRDGGRKARGPLAGASGETFEAPGIPTPAVGPRVSGGLPVPPAPTVSGMAGQAAVEELVRTHARRARETGTSVIDGMVGVKRALSEEGEDVSPDALKTLRKVFVDEFYFAR
jgi:hypothetical protein